MSNWYFFMQLEGKESKWIECLSDRREAMVKEHQPAFSTVLDLNLVPDDNDWSKVKYRGPFYADFDAGDDLPLVCEKFKDFLTKLFTELDFDLSQAKLFASGSKGFHIEIPQECFIQKVPTAGITWLPYIYRYMAQELAVETLDFAVYTGKKGRQWRTTNVQRENGMYKVPLTLDEAMEMTPEIYRELIKAPRPEPVPAPPVINSKFAMLFDRSKVKIASQMRSKKKRMEKSNELLDPWKKAGKAPPTMAKIMAGEDLNDAVGFQSIAMQLAIYATAMGMDRKVFLDSCDGLCRNHVSDSYRYNSYRKRQDELARMFDYMLQDDLYDFDVGPVVRLLKPGTSAADLGVMDRYDAEDEPAETATGDDGDGDSKPAKDPGMDIMRGVRRGFFMNSEGMFRRQGDNDEPICRAVLRNVEAFYDVEAKEFRGYEFDIIVGGARIGRKLLSADAFTSATLLKKFFGGLQVSYQGGEIETSALLDIMAEKAARGGRVYTYPREGLFVLDHPEKTKRQPVICYLTQEVFLTKLPETDPDYFRLRYKPAEAVSTYLIDIHKAPALSQDMKPYAADLLSFNHPEVVANMIGWFIAAHYRSFFLYKFKQFPLLQVFGQAGAGKTASVAMASRLHWHIQPVSITSAATFTNFTLDSKVNSSHSAPIIIDEYKPRELRHIRGRYEKIKDVLKATYVGGETGNRGTVNKGAGESHLSVIKATCAAPLVFMTEAVENETAIIERSVVVKLMADFKTPERTTSFERLVELDDGKDTISAIGKRVVEKGMNFDFDTFAEIIKEIRARLKTKLPTISGDEMASLADRMIFNTAVIIYGLMIWKEIYEEMGWHDLAANIQTLIDYKYDRSDKAEDIKIAKIYGKSEISKVVASLSIASREVDTPYELRLGKDYLVDSGWVEFKVDRAYAVYRLRCAAMRETPLFDNQDAFKVALYSYGPVIDHSCAVSDLREDGSNEDIIRMSEQKLLKDGVGLFRRKS